MADATPIYGDLEVVDMSVLEITTFDAAQFTPQDPAAGLCILGTDGDDTIFGTDFDDIILGFKGRGREHSTVSFLFFLDLASCVVPTANAAIFFFGSVSCNEQELISSEARTDQTLSMEEMAPTPFAALLVWARVDVSEGGRIIVVVGERGKSRVCECACHFPLSRVLCVHTI